jgi:arginase
MEIAIVCVPYQNDVARWGAAKGPQAFLDAGLLEQLRARGHTVGEPVWIDLPRAERTRDSVTNLGRLAQHAALAVRTGLEQGADLVLALEGNCTHAVGPAGGLALAEGQGAPGIIWFDAHGDMNTLATTETGLLGGMPYAVALGWEFEDWRLAGGLREPVRPEAAALLGTSDLDAAEVEALARHPILHLPADELLSPGVAERVQAALKPRAGAATSWYVHIDVDVAGPDEVPGGLTPAPHWPQRAHLLEAGEAAARAVPVKVIGLAAYDPAVDLERRGARFGIDMTLAVVDGTTRQ